MSQLPGGRTMAGYPIDPTTGQPIANMPQMPAVQRKGLLGSLGGMFGGGSYGGLLSEDDQKAAQRQALMAASAQLMSAGGWSPQKTTFGQALGPALIAGQQAQQQSGQDMLQAMLLKTQLQKGSKTDDQREYEYAKANGYTGTFDEWKRVSSTAAKDPAQIQMYNLDVSQGYKGSFEKWRRENPTYNPYRIESIEQVPTIVNPTLRQSTPLSTLGREASAAAQVAGAEAGAKAQATGTVEANLEQKKKSAEFQNTYSLYETARDGLIGGLEGSVTGPISGRIPAVTAAQQTAEGGVAAMAPVLKQLFRASGEGIFTDKDQELLLNMVPKRTDHPEARKAKMANIDAIVKSKLGVGAQSTGPAAGTVEDGYRFKGGDPSKPENWEKQ